MPPRSELQWTDAMDQVLIDELLYQVLKGNKVNGQFTSTAFKETTEVVRTKTHNNSIDKDKIKNRIKTLKRVFGEAYDAFKGLSGFGWNSVTKLFEAEDEVWDELIKSKPQVAQWKTRPISQHDNLKEIWGKDRATDEFGTTSRERLSRWSVNKNIEDDITIDSVDHMVEDQTINLEAYDSQSYYSSQPYVQRTESHDMHIPLDTSTSDGNQSASKSKTHGGSSRKRKPEEKLSVEINGLNTVMGRGVDVLANGNIILERSRSRVHSDDEVFAELERLEIDDAIKLEAYEYLTAEPVRARNMFGLPPYMKKECILKKI